MAHTPFIGISTKRLQISKANTAIVVAVTISVFLLIFTIVSSKALISQKLFLGRVIESKELARNTLIENESSINQLFESYTTFAEQRANILGGDGSGKGSGDRDGDNPKIVLDALPSKYDFPALATSMEKIMTDRNFNIKSLTGTDDELAQSASASTGTPVPIEIPFSFSVDGSYTSVQDLINVLELSIRPIRVKTMQLSGGDSSLNVNVEAITYYQPQKQFTIGSESIK